MIEQTRWMLRAVPALVALLLPFTLLASSARADEPVGAAEPTTVVVEVRSGVYGDPSELKATVTSPAGTPVGTVRFSLGGHDLTGEIPIDGDGVATAVVTETNYGPYHVTAIFTGSDGFASSQGAGFGFGGRVAVHLDPEPTLLRTNPLKVTLTMAATARRPDGRPIPGLTIDFVVGGEQPDLIGGSTGKQVCGATTDANGFASCRGSGGLPALTAILTGQPVWAVHPRQLPFEFAVARVPITK